MNLWQELRRRQMFRLVGLYVVGAWLVIQVADIVFPAWGIPDTALRYLFFAAFLCFPIALVFGWVFDIRKDGIFRTREAGPGEIIESRLQRADYAILVALLAVGLAILLGSVEKIQEEIESLPAPAATIERRDNSIAVLPFTNLDTNPNTGFFSDGITEEILHRLSTLGALHVLASNSSFAFRSSEDGPAEISKKLGVRYLLQGSIRRDSNYVRVTARLVDDQGFQVWSQTFDRELESIFAIQSEIASTVSSQIVNEIVPMQELPAGRTTTNMEAYNAYLSGRAYADARTPDWRDNAIGAYRHAIDLDPGYAPPLAGLAMAMTVNTGRGSQWDEGKQLADKAIALDPQLAEGHAVLGLIVGITGDHARGASSLRHAIQLDPSLAIAYSWLDTVLERQGLQSEADAIEDRGLEIDPLNPVLVANVAMRESRAGNFGRAEQLILRLVNLPDPPQMALPTLYEVYEDWGYLADAVEAAKQSIHVQASNEDPWDLALLAFGYSNLGMAEDADYWKKVLFERVPDDLAMLDLSYNLLRMRDSDSQLGEELLQLVNETEFRETEHHPWTLVQFGLVNIQLGNFEKGSKQLDYGIRLLQARASRTELASSIDVSSLPGTPDDVVFVMHLLTFAYQQVGRSDDADALLQQLTDAFPMEGNALHHALMGDSAGALQALHSQTGARWARYYGPGKYYSIINDPAWAETIKAPEFQKFLAEMKEEVDRQRAIVEAADAEHDFREEINQLLAN